MIDPFVQALILAVVSAVGGGGLAGYFTYRATQRQTTVDTLSTREKNVQDAMNALQEQTRGFTADLQRQVNDVTQRLYAVDEKLVAAQVAIDTCFDDRAKQAGELAVANRAILRLQDDLARSRQAEPPPPAP